MKLTYRGITYDQPQSSLKWQRGPVIGRYRGLLVNSEVVDRIPAQMPRTLQYRGLNYCVDRAGQVGPATANDRQMQGAGSQSPHYASMMASLDHRIEVARSRNDQTLLGILETERQQMA
jgi:hypothetical protein